MAKEETIQIEKAADKAILVIVDFKKHDKDWTFDDEQEEFIALVESTGTEILEAIRVPRDKVDSAMFIGKGKVTELHELCTDDQPDVVIFNKDLSPRQQKNLEEKLEVAVLDRTQLILDIFACHAKTKVGKLQVELAQLQYMLPRLSGKFSAMMRQKGGIGLRGPGETKLEVDRRRIMDKIAFIKKEIEQVAVHRNLLRKKRQKDRVPYVALVGYTSAGKTSLLNSLTGSDKSTHASYFTTLDTVTRTLAITDVDEVLLADTVGFVHDLPQKLVDAFKSTLEELQYADLMLHVIDVSNVHYQKMKKAVETLLEELELNDKPCLYVYNKIDKLDDFAKDNLDYWHKENSLFVSAHSGEGLESLIKEVQKNIPMSVTTKLVVKADASDVLNYIYRNASLNSTDGTEEGDILFDITMPSEEWLIFSGRFEGQYKEL